MSPKSPKPADTAHLAPTDPDLEAMLARDAAGTMQAMQTHFAQGLEAAT